MGRLFCTNFINGWLVGWLCFMVSQPLSVAKSCLYFYIKYSGTSVVKRNFGMNYVQLLIYLKTWVDSASCLAGFGLPWQSFVYVPFSSAQLVCSNSEYLFDHWGIFYSNFLVELWIVQLESCNLLSFLLRCSTRPYERGTQWDSNSFV